MIKIVNRMKSFIFRYNKIGCHAENHLVFSKKIEPQTHRGYIEQHVFYLH